MRPSVGRSKPAAASASGSRKRHAVDPFRGQYLASSCGPNPPRAPGIRSSPCEFSANSDAAAASSRKSISIFTVRASVSTTSTGFSRRARGTSARRAAPRNTCPRDRGGNAARRPAAAPSPRHRARRSRRGRGRDAPARWRRRRPARRIRQDLVDRPPEAASIAATADLAGNGGMRSCSRSRSPRDIGADNIRPRRQKLAELDVGRAEPADRRRQDRRPFVDALGERSSASAERQRARPAAKPRYRHRETRRRGRARNRRAQCAEHAREISRIQSFQPEWMATMPPVSRVRTRARSPASAIMREYLRRAGKRRIDFDEIAIGLAIARHQARRVAEWRGMNRPRRVCRDAALSTCENSRQRNRPPRFNTRTAPGERPLDARHVADAEGDRIGVECIVRETAILRHWPRRR